MKISELWDEYEIKARYIPCLIAVFPFVHFMVLIIDESFWNNLINSIGWLLVIANVGLSLIVVIFLVQVQCGIAKHWIESSVFGKGGKRFPTTDMLLFNGGYVSMDMKNRIRDKIANLHGVTFLDIKQENKNPEEARMVAREAVGLVRRSVGKGVRTHQYNVRYGFARNLIGGFIWGLAGSIGCVVFYLLNGDWEIVALFGTSAIIFLLLYLFKAKILSQFAFTYADTLFNEFLSNRGNENA